jgi:hypothetical protein
VPETYVTKFKPRSIINHGVFYRAAVKHNPAALFYHKLSETEIESITDDGLLLLAKYIDSLDENDEFGKRLVCDYSSITHTRVNWSDELMHKIITSGINHHKLRSEILSSKVDAWLKVIGRVLDEAIFEDALYAISPFLVAGKY